MKNTRKILFIVSIIYFAAMSFGTATETASGRRRLGGVDIYDDERECISKGGLCVKKTDCLELHAERGLCPLNAPYGVECCARTPIRPAPCREHLGECMPQCSKTIQRPATDCLKGQVCCVLVRK